MSGRTPVSSMLLAVLLVSFQGGAASAALLEVPEDHETIAAALAAASHGDTVSIAPGNYYEHDLLLPPGVSLVGRSGSPGSVVIDAQELGRVLLGGELDEQNLLAHFTARAGNAQGWPGAGLYLSGPCTLRNLIVEDCSTTTRGAGAHCTHPYLIEDCVFRNNRCTGAESDAGGLYIIPIPWTGSIVRRTDFIGNEARWGAAIWAYASYPIIFDSIRVFQNSGWSAIHLYNGEVAAGAFMIENSILAGNTGIGIYAVAGGTVRSCTIVDCRGGLVVQGSWATSSYVHMDGCLITHNAGEPEDGGVCSVFGEYAGYVLVSCSDVYKNLPANYSGMLDQTGFNGNTSADPRFCAGAGPEEFALREDSPCAPANNACGVLMGAFPVGCESTSTAQSSWSAIKAMY